MEKKKIIEIKQCEKKTVSSTSTSTHIHPKVNYYPPKRNIQPNNNTNDTTSSNDVCLAENSYQRSSQPASHPTHTAREKRNVNEICIQRR